MSKKLKWIILSAVALVLAAVIVTLAIIWSRPTPSTADPSLTQGQAPVDVDPTQTFSPDIEYPTMGDQIPPAGTLVSLDSVSYSYEELQQDLDNFRNTHNEAEVFSAGKTAFGRDIFAVRFGKADAPHRVLIVGGVKGTESYTSRLIMKQLDTYLADPGQVFKTRTYRETADGCAIFFVPMLNPDGVNLNLQGMQSVPEDKKSSVEAIAAYSVSAGLMQKDHFEAWTANGMGEEVFLNFGTGTVPSSELMPEPASSDYIGATEFSSLEAKALVTLCGEKRFDAVLTYSGQGNMIDWYFGQTMSYNESDVYVSWLENLTRYVKIDAANGVPRPDLCRSVNFSQWFIHTYDRAGLTLMIGKTIPQSKADMEEIWKYISVVPLYMAYETLYIAQETDGESTTGSETLATPSADAGKTNVPVQTPGTTPAATPDTQATVSPGTTPIHGGDDDVEIEYGEME